MEQPTVTVDTPVVEVDASGAEISYDTPAVNVPEAVSAPEPVMPVCTVEAPTVRPAVEVEAEVPAVETVVNNSYEEAPAENAKVDISTPEVAVSPPAVAVAVPAKGDKPDKPAAKEAETKVIAKGDYSLKEMTPFGAEVTGLNLSGSVSDATIAALKEDVHRYKVLVFRDQGELGGDRQIEVTEWFGEIETAGFELHDKSPDRRILRVSNDEAEGYVGFGTAGFHVDGSFMDCPNAHSIYHMVSAPSEGETFFVGWSDVMNGLPRSKRHLWRRLSMLKTFKRIRGFQDEPGEVIHPVVYKHPVTDEPTMCLSLGKLSRFYMDYKTPSERKMDKEETESFEVDINTEIRRGDDALLYKHQWQNGDLVITDNLAVGHMASNGTQRSREDIGLRILHRTVTKGTVSPRDAALIAKNQKCILM